jgi:hypothetical protein
MVPKSRVLIIPVRMFREPRSGTFIIASVARLMGNFVREFGQCRERLMHLPFSLKFLAAGRVVICSYLRRYVMNGRFQMQGGKN